MQYYNYLSIEQANSLFYCLPRPFDNFSNPKELSYAVGAALYYPGNRRTLVNDILTKKFEALTSLVIDLEDSVDDLNVIANEQSIIDQLNTLYQYVHNQEIASSGVPLLFIRIRNSNQLQSFISRLHESIVLITGFIFPKFTSENGFEYLEIIKRYNRDKNKSYPPLYGLPILETPDIIYKESRLQSLLAIKQLLDDYAPYVLNVRIGATDFSSLFGLKRSRDMTIYDIVTVRDCIADVINIFNRVDSSYVISGPVWEYYEKDDNGILIKEIKMDKENGIIGKTIIHPNHLKLVQSIYVVTHEEYVDAMTILNSDCNNNGVVKSEYGNKMNEVKPHTNWAKRILLRSKIYGVLNEHKQYQDLLSV